MHNNEELYYKQVRILQTFLEHGAISQAQYDKSYHDLSEKMGFALNDHPSHDVSCYDSSGTDS